MLWAIWIAGLMGVFYGLYRLARAAGRRPDVHRRLRTVERSLEDTGAIARDPEPAPPIDLRARRVEKTVEALERRVLELEARLRKVEGRD